ncbi:MAG: carbamoyltransferase HypF [Oscillatoriophycideae cyanobacterium NC_groundwater_1537_Pr4_S-0.65um_50_18]|nr:carbamoyltransferase HypF [Oscillatoriophycideae cyanobacterium NC_groundwater_1537_Pr4_S-0.65um_50_18]
MSFKHPLLVNQAQRLRIRLRGAVQGIGLRPFVYRLAQELHLAGWVSNSASGVEIEVEGERSHLVTFLHYLTQDYPSRANIQSIDYSVLKPIGYSIFEIRSSVEGAKTATILPDLATCSDCLKDIRDPNNRRYCYPFTNCTQCGPRFSIIEAIPYDRASTTMRSFQMCDQCQTEYESPLNRRFHAQPNACPQCGPHLECWNAHGQILAAHNQALQMTAEAIQQGQIVAVKGLGGFHLMVDASNDRAIQRLRQAKHRDEKPFALMYPSLDRVKAHCLVSDVEEDLLCSPSAPIVLLQCKSTPSPFPTVAPNTPYLGIMLPYTPLHHLLMAKLGIPLVATSGNLADEPICTDEHEALEQFGQIAAVFLMHNRPIARPIDDSIVREMAGQEMVLRRARGYAPLPIQGLDVNSTLLAVGAHLKNAIAFSIPPQVFVSQHIGDLATVQTWEAFQRAIASFQSLYDLQPNAIACDLHPDYRSTPFAHKLAEQLTLPLIPVQHHYAHVLSCMAEHQLSGSILGVAWDGTGYGLDGTIWGGEFLHVTDTAFQRIAHLRPFPLPGGETAVKEPRRAAIGLLYELFGNDAFEMQSLAPLQVCSSQELRCFKTMLNQQINTSLTTSAGRLFDAIASLIGLRQSTQFEGQAAMALEFAMGETTSDELYPFSIRASRAPTSSTLMIDWADLVHAMLEDMRSEMAHCHLAIKFHNTLVEMIVHIAQHLGEHRIVLSGGCFQNKYLTERTIQRLQAEGFCPYWHRRIPPNDGGIAVGQILAALRQQAGGNIPCV